MNHCRYRGQKRFLIVNNWTTIREFVIYSVFLLTLSNFNFDWRLCVQQQRTFAFGLSSIRICRSCFPPPFVIFVSTGPGFIFPVSLLLPRHILDINLLIPRLDINTRVTSWLDSTYMVAHEGRDRRIFSIDINAHNCNQIGFNIKSFYIYVETYGISLLVLWFIKSSSHKRNWADLFWNCADLVWTLNSS